MSNIQESQKNLKKNLEKFQRNPVQSVILRREREMKKRERERTIINGLILSKEDLSYNVAWNPERIPIESLVCLVFFFFSNPTPKRILKNPEGGGRRGEMEVRWGERERG